MFLINQSKLQQSFVGKFLLLYLLFTCPSFTETFLVSHIRKTDFSSLLYQVKNIQYIFMILYIKILSASNMFCVCTCRAILPNLDRIPDPFTMENMKSDQFSRGNDAFIFIYNLDNIFAVEVFRLKAFIPR